MRNETGETPSTGQRLISTVEIKPHGGCETTPVLQSVMGESFSIDLTQNCIEVCSAGQHRSS